LTILATGAGILTLIIKKMSQSKCDEISFCGIHIHRRVDLETNDDISEEDKAKGIRI